MTPGVPTRRPPPPRLALTIAEAAMSVGVSEDFFRAHVLDDLRVVQVGRKKLVSVAEIERWLKNHEALLLEAYR